MFFFYLSWVGGGSWLRGNGVFPEWGGKVSKKGNKKTRWHQKKETLILKNPPSLLDRRKPSCSIISRMTLQRHNSDNSSPRKGTSLHILKFGGLDELVRGVRELTNSMGCAFYQNRCFGGGQYLRFATKNDLTFSCWIFLLNFHTGLILLSRHYSGSAVEKLETWFLWKLCSSLQQQHHELPIKAFEA